MTDICPKNIFPIFFFFWGGGVYYAYDQNAQIGYCNSNNVQGP